MVERNKPQFDHDDEASDLNLHVKLCSLRYGHLERRLDVVEGKLDSISNSLSKTRLDFFKVMIGTAGTIVVSVVSAVALVLSK